MKKSIFLFCILFSSCIGIESRITIKDDGSGLIALEYRISRELLELGALDGNAAYPAVPVGKVDFERTVERVPGLTLRDWSESAEEADGTENIIYRVKLGFNNFEALCAFMDAQGMYFSYSKKDGRNVLTVTVIPPAQAYSTEYGELLPVIFEGYTFKFALKTPSPCDVKFFSNGKARDVPAAGKLAKTGDEVEYTADMAEVFGNGKSTAMEISWL